MTRINLRDTAYVAYRAPDLDLMERFLSDFGMVRAERTEGALYMRGAGSRPFVHLSRLGEKTAFEGAAFVVESAADLERASRIPGASGIEDMPDPGGGRRVSLSTPGGYTIWLEHGAEPAASLPARAVYPLNFSEGQLRFNRSVRQRAEALPVLRLGHFVLWVGDLAREVAWFTEHFDLVPSDHFRAPGDPDPVVVGTFLRYDRGSEFVEHHCLLITQSENLGCHHSSFEVLDLDAVMAGHEHLVQRGWTLDAGVGRHLLGSLIYDYWLDPFGNRIEHYTDADFVNDDHEPEFFDGTADETTQWGMAPPPSFFD